MFSFCKYRIQLHFSFCDYSLKQSFFQLSNLMISQAKGGEDFTIVSGQFVLFLGGLTTTVIPIPVIDDSIPELDEKFYLRLTAVVLDDGNVSTSDTPMLGQLRQSIITIRSSDSAFGMFRLYSLSAGPSVRVIEVNEINRLSVDLVVERSGKLVLCLFL